MTIERVFPSGAIRISKLHRGYLVTQVYYYYTVKEAKQLFREHLKEISQ